MHHWTARAALALFAALIVVGLIGALGWWGLPALVLLGAAVLAPPGRLPAAVRSRRVRALLAWSVGLLVVALATLGEDDPLRTVCEGGECSTRSVAEADGYFVAYLASAAAFGVWVFVRRGRERDGYASDQSSPAA